MGKGWQARSVRVNDPMMNFRRFSLPILLFLVLTGIPNAALAQGPPNYSGTWAAVVDPTPSATGQPVRLFGQEFVVRQDSETLAITRLVGETTITTIHKLDGSETRTRRPGRLCEADSELVHIAKWDGDGVRITMVGAVPPGGGPIMKREATWLMRLRSPDTLTVEIIPTRDGKATRPASTSYKRTASAPPLPPAATHRSNVHATIAQVAWLSGVWMGTLGSSTIEERWTPPAGGSMLAIGRTIRGGVMGAFEFLCIVEREGSLVYTAMPNGRQPATDFALTRIEGESLTFENPAHDFPKMIRYTRMADGSLEAVISGDASQKPQTFVFKKQPSP
jgi:hypothetical protein